MGNDGILLSWRGLEGRPTTFQRNRFLLQQSSEAAPASTGAAVSGRELMGRAAAAGEEDLRGWSAKREDSLLLDGESEPETSSSSSVAASSSCSSPGINGIYRLVHCEVEEIPSQRWLPSPLRWRPSPSRGGLHDRTTWSPLYGSAAESPRPIDWGGLLPSDYQEILSRAVVPVEYSSMEQLYLRLCQPILIDKGLKSVWLEESTGKKCFMHSAKAIKIWGNDARHWRWISVPNSRFPEVAALQEVCWLEIRGSISCQELSPATRYGAYLVMRHADTSYGLGFPLQQTVISVGGVQASTRIVRFWHDRAEGVCVPRARGDGWMELEMGDFVVEAGGEELVDVRLKGRQCLPQWKSGLVVLGLEVRPMPYDVGNPIHVQRAI